MAQHTVTVNGKPVEIIPLSEMTVKELRLVKATSGMTPSVVAAVLDEMDPDAWLAVLLVSVQRVEPDASVEDLENLGLADLIASLDSGEETEVPPVEGAEAPAISSEQPSGEPSTSPSSTDGSSEPETTPVDSGVPV